MQKSELGECVLEYAEFLVEACPVVVGPEVEADEDVDV
jgi:hypothetical protein